MNSEIIYHKLCESRKHNKIIYGPGSGLHRHHIIPIHNGGEDLENNVTYLTPREHVIAHYLLWRINKNPNDLRSMHMLGAELTPIQRKITGEFCRDNKLGMFNPKYKDQLFEWRKKGIQTQYESKIGIHDPKMKPKYATMGGKVGGKKQFEQKIGIHSHTLEEKRYYSSLGAKALTGWKCMHKPGEGKYIRVKPSDIETKKLEGYIMGKGKRSYKK